MLQMSIRPPASAASDPDPAPGRSHFTNGSPYIGGWWAPSTGPGENKSLATSNASGNMLIETPRLILRMYAARDLDALHQMSADPEAFRYSERGPMGSEDAWARLLRHVGHWALAGYGLFAVEDKDSGRLAGEVGLSDFRRQLGFRFDGCPEISWAIARWAQGRGYATEAAGAALRLHEARFAAQRTVCLIHEDNRASLRVAEKLGYRPFHRRAYRGYPATLLERLR